MTPALSVVTKVAAGRVNSFKQTASAASAQGAEVVAVYERGAGVRDRLRRVDGVDTTVGVDSPGLNRARNVGATVARADRVAFVDDDAYPEPGWADAIVDALDDADLAGGPLVPDWTSDPVEWLPREWHWIIGCGPYYDEPQFVPNTYGSNIAARSAVLDDVSFDESIGLGVPGSTGQGGETMFARRARDAGYTGVWYCPDARVRHAVDGVGVRSAASRAFWQGRAKARLGAGRRESRFVRDELVPSLVGSPSDAAVSAALTGVVAAGYAVGKLFG